MEWKDLSPALGKGLQRLGIRELTEIQKETFAPALAEKNIVGCSPTGTGKTFAYLLPVIQKNQPDGGISKELYAMIVAPSKELCIQICREINRISNNSGVPVTAAALFGGVNKERQKSTLKSHPNIVVGTYPRLYELIKERKLPAHQVKTLIVDEADQLCRAEHLDGMLALRKCLMRDTQIMLFSASMKWNMDGYLADLSKEEFVKIFTKDKLTIPTNIHHFYFVTERRERIEEVRKVIKASGTHRCLIFASSQYDADEITQKLQYHHYSVECLHAKDPSNKRRQVMDSFAKGDLEFIVCSDLAARGIHFDSVDTVINIGLPDQPNDYLHRAGRCGRDGKESFCLSILTENELSRVKAIQKTFSINFCAKKLYQGAIVRK